MAVFEVTEVKGGGMVKKHDFETKKTLNKCKKNQTSIFNLMLYCHFHAINSQRQKKLMRYQYSHTFSDFFSADC